VALLLTAVMTKKMSPTGALILIPTVTGVLASFFIRGEDGTVLACSADGRCFVDIRYR